ncbi:MAG: alkaline phosphatase D family protein [Bacteroidota bacterium]
MKYFLAIIVVLTSLSCRKSPDKAAAAASEEQKNTAEAAFDFTLVFASCNDQEREQPLWKPIIDHQPDLFVWGGDNIYADTEDMAKMKADYDKVAAHPDYKALAEMTAITGTWDDHDLGENDAGNEYPKIEESKKLMLDFLNVPSDDERRSRDGVYTSQTFTADQGSIKLILLDTRSFRDSLKKSKEPMRRYDAWPEGEGGTLLGAAQWQWLEEELNDDSANFTLIVSSIQFLNDSHGWEKWGNHTSEVKKMEQLLQGAAARNILFLSGDRHMAEISVDTEAGLSYPLIDFTSSGLTHTWIDGATEGNVHRISNVVKRLNFGVLGFDFEKNTVTFEIRGEDDFLYERHIQQY